MGFAQDLGKWLTTIAWTHVLTLTFGLPVSPHSARRQIERYFTHVGGIEAYFWVLERGPGTGRVHGHVLVLTSSRPAGPGLERAWHRGHAQAEDYDANRGAAYYLTKAIDDEDVVVDWDFQLP